MNLTISLDDELIVAAKLLAARRKTSVTALVAAVLEQQVALDGQVTGSRVSGVLRSLVEYSLGRLPRSAAMQSLGISDYRDLIALMGAARLPLPVISLTSRKVMADKMLDLLNSARS